MALNKLIITNGFWKKLSTAGYSGTAWMKNVGPDGTSKVVIAHTTSTQPQPDDVPVGTAVDLDIEIGYVLSQSGSVSNQLTADNGNDIYYATLRDVGETCEIIVDFA